jgi:hypothetical protein
MIRTDVRDDIKSRITQAPCQVGNTRSSRFKTGTLGLDK